MSPTPSVMAEWSALPNNRRRDALWTTQGGLCWYCGVEVAHSTDWTPTETGFILNSPRRSCAIEHQIPRCNGGTNAPENLVLACAPCNSQKGRRDVEQYREWLGIEHFHGERP